jgi:CBS domain-containing protein
MHDIAEFLSRHDPFSKLAEAELARLAARVEVEFFAAGTTIFRQGEGPQQRVRVVRRGAVELVEGGNAFDLLGEGEMFGHPSMLSGSPTGFEARAAGDTLCYAIAAEDAIPLLARPAGLRFLGRAILDRPRPGGHDAAEVARLDAWQQPVTTLIRERPVICEPDVSVREAIQRLESEGASSILVRLNGGGFGIVTDRDLRSNLIAKGLSVDVPVSEVMTAPAFCIGPERKGVDLLVAMLDRGIHHVPIVSGRSKVLGVVREVDVLAAQTRTPFVLRRAIDDAATVSELRPIAHQLNPTVVALHRAGLHHAQISAIVSVVSDSLIRRMIEIAVDSAGPPPVEFAWFSLGSHGRREAVPSSDVDSGMAWADEPEPSDPEGRPTGADAARYMRAIADDVAHSLRFIGWRLDPHGVTASGAFSASSIGEWCRAIRSWLAHPDDERVLIATSILLDGRTVHGPNELSVTPIFYEAEGRSTLLRWMLRLALSSKPPTGFMHDIVVEGSGEHRGTFDIKRGGLLPIVDLARYGSLKAGLELTSTVKRLRASATAGALAETEAMTLEEAYTLFAALRLEHQVNQLEQGSEPDNHIDPKELNPLTRRYLRDAFRAVASVQKALVGELSRSWWEG